MGTIEHIPIRTQIGISYKLFEGGSKVLIVWIKQPFYFPFRVLIKLHSTRKKLTEREREEDDRVVMMSYRSIVVST